MIIREMRKDDLARILQIDQQSFSHVYSKEDFLYEFDSNVYAKLYVLEDKEIIGYIDMWVVYERGELARIAIDPTYRKKGYAQYLFNEVCKMHDLESVSLEVRVSNQNAINLYEKLGFKPVAIRKNYYENHEDGILMVKEEM